MKLLVDTQAFLYYFRGDPRLSARARILIDDVINELLLSTGSVREMAIKSSLGKLNLGEPLADFISRRLDAYRFRLLPITLEHMAVVSRLPFHHRDPFDRLLIAQSMVEGLPLVSRDQAFDAYGINRIW